MINDQLKEDINVFRRFNRYYTKQIGLLNQGLLATPFNLTQARILFEIAQHKQCTASDLINELNIDPGYLSRILYAFEQDGLIRRVQSPSDSRKWLLGLNAKGKEAFSDLNERSTKEAEALLRRLLGEDLQRLIHAMQTIEDILEAKSKPSGSFLMRRHRPGDIGWMTHRHGALYNEEYDWDETFEALVGEILVKFIKKHDPERERIWIAEQDGEQDGMVMIVDAGDNVAQLRLLLVEPKARGKGLGKRLIDECIDFSRQNGYRKIKLWTQSNLLEARHLYSKVGFKLVYEKPHTSFGHDLIEEIWELPLRD